MTFGVKKQAALGVKAGQQSRRLIERLNDANVPARLAVREDAGHAYPGWEADTALIADWFDAHLRRVR